MTNAENYKIYLKSKEWETIRNKVLLRDGEWCQDCKMAIGTEVHHLTYKNIFKENIDDLITLCPVCHGIRHGIKKSIKGEYEQFVYDECRRLMEKDD